MQPTAKVSIAGGVAGALTILLVWILEQFHVSVPAEVASSMTTLIAFLASWQCHTVHAITTPPPPAAEEKKP